MSITPKGELVKKLASAHGMGQRETLALFNAVLRGITDTLLADGRMELRDFGVFEVKLRGPRKCRNPRTGETVIRAPDRIVVFSPGREMSRQANGEISE